eukprot:COSAG01_NODE_41686_length_448_cov_1.203438_1_plen_70_part_10
MTVSGLAPQIAMDYSNCGIRCVSVSPGTILTPLVNEVITSDPVQVHAPPPPPPPPGPPPPRAPPPPAGGK